MSAGQNIVLVYGAWADGSNSSKSGRESCFVGFTSCRDCKADNGDAADRRTRPGSLANIETRDLHEIVLRLFSNGRTCHEK